MQRPKPEIEIRFEETDMGICVTPLFTYKDTDQTYKYSSKLDVRSRWRKMERDVYLMIGRSINPNNTVRRRKLGTGRWLITGPMADQHASMLYLKLSQYDVEVSWKRANRQPKSEQLRISSGTDWFDVTILLDDKEFSLQDALNRMFGSGDIDGMIPSDDFQRMLVELSSYQDKIPLSALIGMYIDGALIDDSIKKDLDEAIEIYENRNSDPEIPSSLDAELYPHQKEGLAWLQTMSRLNWGALLADDMGLGKTLQTLAWILWKSKQGQTKHLIAVPKSVLLNWASELQRFCPTMNFQIYHGSNRQLDGNVLVTLTTIGTVRSDVETLTEVEWDTVVIDEAQYIKNHNTSTAKAFKKLIAQDRLALTGTPVENNVLELHSVFSFICPDLLRNKKAFNKKFGSSVLTEWKKQQGESLNRAIGPYMLRRTKAETLTDLPKKIINPVILDMPEHQAEIYQREEDFYAKTIKSAPKKMKGMIILKALTKLRQICDHPVLGILDQDDWNSDELPVKLGWLDDRLYEWEDQPGKVLVFSQYVSYLHMISELLAYSDIPHLMLTGATQDRQSLVDRFQEDDTERVFLISLKAGGVGLNLTRADKVVIMDPWWNPAVENQAIDRAYRIGQQSEVNVYKLYCKDTIEEKIQGVQKVKQQIFSTVVDGKGNEMKSFSLLDAWKELIS